MNFPRQRKKSIERNGKNLWDEKRKATENEISYGHARSRVRAHALVRVGINEWFIIDDAISGSEKETEAETDEVKAFRSGLTKSDHL